MTIAPLRFEEKGLKLKECLHKEVFISNISTAIDQTQGTKSADMVLVEKSIPCIFYVNMRISEKFVKIILQEGLNDYLDISDAFISGVETFMSTRAFRKNVLRVGQCFFPRLIRDKGLTGEFTFKGNQAEIVLEESDELIDICAPDPERNPL